MRADVYSSTNLASMKGRIFWRGPNRKFAIAAPAAWAIEFAPRMPVGWAISPAIALGEAHSSLNVPVRMNRPRHPRPQSLIINKAVDSSFRLRSLLALIAYGQERGGPPRISGNHAAFRNQRPMTRLHSTELAFCAVADPVSTFEVLAIPDSALGDHL
jgi:hypothetical protein